MITFYVMVSARLKWKTTVKNFVFVNENQFTWRSSQNYTLSYYQLTFSESNRLYCFKDLCLVIHKRNFNNYKIRAAWSRTTEPQAPHRMKPSARETLIWLESVTEKVTGNAQPGACVDVFPRCSLGPVARSLVSANRWLRGIEMYRFPWYLTLVSTNHASSNPGKGPISLKSR